MRKKSVHLYYLIKRFIPRHLQLSLRRQIAFRKIDKIGCKWPIDDRANSGPEAWTGWPDGKQFSLVLTHDVDTQKGHDRCLQLAEIEEKLGFRSSFNFVVDDYTVSSELRQELVNRGFEVGVHGLTHDASLYRSEVEFKKQAKRINQILKEWGAVGFRSPCMYHNLEWLSFLDIEYDASTFDTDPFEPQPTGLNTIYPIWFTNENEEKGYVELPYTLPQDFTLFVLLQKSDIGIWIKKLNWIAVNGGMVLINVHPDYMTFSKFKCFDEYPVDYYKNFLESIRENYDGKYWHTLPKEMAAFWKRNCGSRRSLLNLPELRAANCDSPSTHRRSLNVCQLAYTFYESDNRVIRYSEFLKEQGSDVDVIALRDQKQDSCTECNDIRVFHIQRRTLNEKTPLSYLLKILLFMLRAMALISIKQLKRPYDLIHIHNVPDFLVFAAWLPKLMGAKIILDIHDILPELFAGKFGASENCFIFYCMLAIEKLSCAFANHVIVANDIWREKLIRRALPENKCTTIMNYPDLRMFKPLPKSAQEKEGRFIMMYPGSLNHHQGLDIAIKAFARIKDVLPNMDFQIYGSGPSKAELIKLVNQLDLGERVFFPPGLPIKNMSKVMSAADLGIVPKRADGFGNEAFSTKTLEFMACGVPIIVSKTRIDQYYFDDSIVVFFKPGDVNDLAEAIRKTANNKEKMRELSENALKYVSDKSWKKHKSIYDCIITRLITNPSNRDKKC